MADVKRSAVTPTVAQAISRIAVANSTTDATSSFALWGGLEANAVDVVASTITGAVGQLYLLTANSGTPQTATVDFTLPSASVGERIGVYHVDGDPAYEIVLKGATSQSINGGADATEWSRLFIQGECVIFRCIAAGDWIVEYDGSEKPYCHITGDGGAAMTIGTSTFTNVIGSTGPLDTVVSDRHSWYTASNGRITPTIKGRYLISASYVVGDVSLGSRVIANIYNTGSVDTLIGRVSSGGTNHYIGGSGIAIVTCNGTTDYINLNVWCNDASNLGVSSGADGLIFSATLLERL